MPGYWQLAEPECRECGRDMQAKTPPLSYGDKGYYIRCGGCGHINWASGTDYSTPDAEVA